ncbi:hypothetical protein [Streptomyces sp. NPDC048057]|uniref:hypothetical protein n=1 Tax=Streptomyces sp. NPDC048057 TaxID=3155628 RepID=UPI0033F46441
MRLPRAALTVAAVALAPTLLLATPAFAGDSTGAAPRASAAGAAATPTAGGCPTVTVGELDDHDVRIAILRLMSHPDTGKAVYAAAEAAMNGTVQDQRNFLEKGCWEKQYEDDRVAVFRILGLPTTTPAVRAAAVRALEIGTPEALRDFLVRGQYEAKS